MDDHHLKELRSEAVARARRAARNIHRTGRPKDMQAPACNALALVAVDVSVELPGFKSHLAGAGRVVQETSAPACDARRGVFTAPAVRKGMRAAGQ